MEVFGFTRKREVRVTRAHDDVTRWLQETPKGRSQL